MRAFLRHLVHDRGAAAAVEFGLVMPLFIILLIGTLEIGNYINQASMLEKGLRAGAMYAARANDLKVGTTLAGGTITATENMVVTGDPTDRSTANFVLGGWADCDPTPITSCLTITVDTRTGTEGATTVKVKVIKLRATVPYDPILEGALSLIGLSDLTMDANHEQAWIGS